MKTAARALTPFAAERAAAAPAHYALPMVDGECKALAMGWLALALGALVVSGVFSVLLVLARTPGLQRLFPVADFFRVALVVHVDLSVLVRFAAMAGVLWTVNSAARHARLGRAALILAGPGAAVMAASAFFGHGRPVMSNYVPVLDDTLFLYGLIVFGIGFALLALRGLLAPATIDARLDGAGALRFGLNASVVAAATAIAALVWSWAALPAALDGKVYYELLFWGGGHAIQFTWTLLMLVAWLWLATLARGAHAAHAARGGPALRHRARFGVRGAAHLLCVGGHFAAASHAAHLAHALRRGARDTAGRGRGDARHRARSPHAGQRGRCAPPSFPRSPSSRSAASPAS